MGSLQRFDLTRFPADCFVETGTYLGQSLRYARQYPFKHLHSVRQLFGPPPLRRQKRRMQQDRPLSVVSTPPLDQNVRLNVLSPGPEMADRLADAFRTGIGVSYQDHGPNAAHRTERMLGPWTRRALVPQIIPALDGVDAKLRAGACVADVGCGAGVALLAMAEAYPSSQFHGYDPSGHAIERARQKVAEQGLSNVELHEAGGEELPGEPTYDFIITLDCIHDMTRPDEVIQAIRSALQPDGTWMIKDIRSAPRFEDNLRNPLLAMFYGFSVSACMSSALSEAGGAGLGTLGFNPEVAERMTAQAGFTRFVPHDFEDPANLYYEVRP